MELTPTITTEQDELKTNNKQSLCRLIIHVFTGFRALACLWVFIGHCGLKNMDEFVALNIKWVGYAGEAGVAVFFCLSGFIMVWNYGDCEFKSARCYWSFIGRRVSRLFPLYYFSLLLSIYDIRCVWSEGTSCTVSNWIYILSTLLIITTWIPYVLNTERWNFVTWSVQTEWFFYLAFPFLIRLIRYLLNTTRISLLSHVENKKKTLKRLHLMWYVVLCISTIFLLIRLILHDDLTVSLTHRQTDMI
ncbi:unnamed protein product [Adineta ricciae]|uniref:Acyltransferase 3 domain-containing protein n=1 Tax=Adineta ricciae TaxID=249248 RepID=A0A815UGH8_ADIRI|nr:unnamed protein product [Adineta ricciae]CAF1515579.1 unnamed protein product [Adineta ricciae]